MTGVLADPGDIGAFADALQAYAEDPALRERHGSAGLEFAKTQDWDAINSNVVKTYLRAIERRERLARIKG